MPVNQIQLGKQGLTDNFISMLSNRFDKSQTVRISVLKSARESKKQVREFSEKILDKLGKNYTARVIGFTIIVKKWRRVMR